MTQSKNTLTKESNVQENRRQETHSRPGLSAFTRYVNEAVRRNWIERDSYNKTVSTVFTNKTLSGKAST